jgi:site-specific DNA recombinase
MDVKADIYLRLSDLRDPDVVARGGTAKTFEARETALRDLAGRLGWDVHRVVIENDVIDGGKGRSTRIASAFKRRKVTLPDGSKAMRVYRPGFRGILDDFVAGRAHALLGEDLDRCLRDPRDLEDLIDIVEAKGLNVRSLSGSLTLTDGGTDSEITMARVMVAVANKSSRDTSRRVRNQRARQVQEGVPRPGPRAFGFEPDGKTPRPAEANRLRDAAERVLAGETLYGMVAEWNAAGVTTSTGRPWSTSKLSQLLARPRNAGRLEHCGKIVARNAWEAIIPEDVYDSLMDVLADPSRRTNPGRAPQWLGSGIYRCWGCERPSLRVSGTTKRVRTYRCDGAVPPLAGRHHVARVAVELDEYVETFLAAYLSRREHRDLFAMPEPTVDVKALRAERIALRARLKKQAAWHAIGDLSDDEFLAGRRHGQARLDQIQRDLASVPSGSPLQWLVEADDIVEAWFGKGPDRIDGLSLERRRVTLNAVARITVLPQRSRAFDPGAVEILCPPPRG